MERQFRSLPIHELGADAGFRRPVQPPAARVSLESKALEVMTDLLRAIPATIRPQAPIEGANNFMISRGVRLLLVVDERDVVLGVVTSTDVLGEKSMRVAIERGIKRQDLMAGDIMTPASQVEVLALDDVESARVGHVLETLRKAGRQHALVVDFDVIPPNNLIDRPVRRTMVRGVFSISQLARQLGVSLQSSGEVARTFSEIEAALSG
ncbi:MAG TPA: CBS domain-containing protein [Burkholderiales bacterium]|nr:CBS domain-containing protein [Burkholderiales bacterium]